MSRSYVALDRDGTLIVEKNYLSDPSQVELLPTVLEGLTRLRRAGFGLLVVSNQSGVGRGYFSLDDVARVNARLAELAGPFDGIYVCPHLPDAGCRCRKPKPGLLEKAARELGFDLANCFVVGDKASDVELARQAGGKAILVTTGYGAGHLASGQAKPDHVAATFLAAAEWIASSD
ncbi:MAG: HAD family hydrolase [Candidatus Solibacter sp.]|nr:HAD family hydrolase [Candidatus Solibacter sp.]